MNEKYAFLILGFCLGILAKVFSTKTYPYLKREYFKFKQYKQ